jgi:AcrR family transcriptional regulator
VQGHRFVLGFGWQVLLDSRERPFVLEGGNVPRITAEHGFEVRTRILRAAMDVFGEHGFHRSTMQDVVSASGLSVGAIYTYFKSKDELFLACCDLTAADVATIIAERLTHGHTTAERLSLAVGFFLDTLDGDASGLHGTTVLVHAWAEADQEPAVREMLVRRREQIVTIARMLLSEGAAAGEIPAWADIEALAVAYGAMLDGLSLVRIEAGARYRRANAERQALAMLELLLAAVSAPRPNLSAAPATPYAPPLGVG